MTSAAKKFLCVCEGGNVRSHALAYVLHDVHGQEAICVGWRRIGGETLDYLCKWADYIVLMQAAFRERILKVHEGKIRILDVGPDRFGMWIHPELLDFVQKNAADWATRGFEI
jgi:predicted protein tyrosine phosphatase